ncbi:MAG: aminotransferase class I/II-fold pyridoxal phosphate-dependent enzyme [Acidimicrobiales bacterium]
MTVQSYATGRTAARIAASIEESIRDSRLAAGDVLLPIRDLASELGVSAGTVAAAYRLLNAQGLTSADRRRGTRVRELRRDHAPLPRQARMLPPGVTDLSTGNPDPALLPDLERSMRLVSYERALYGSPVAHGGFLEEARRRFESDGIPASSVTVAHGALDAIGRMLAANLSPGDRVAVEDPGWASLIDLVERLGLVVVPVALDQEGPLADSLWQVLAAGARAAVVTARAQNPTGAAISADRAATLRELLARYPGCLVIEDDHACGLVETPLQSVVGTTGRYAAVRSVAKGYGPDFRLAAVAGDMATIGRLEASITGGTGWVSHLLQQVMLAMWADPEVAGILENASAIYRQRRLGLCDELTRRGIEAQAATGLNIWVPVGDEATAVSTLLTAGWRVAPGAMCRIVSEPAIRVTTAALPLERSAECAEAIAGACLAAGFKGRRSASGG